MKCDFFCSHVCRGKHALSIQTHTQQQCSGNIIQTHMMLHMSQLGFFMLLFFHNEFIFFELFCIYNYIIIITIILYILYVLYLEFTLVTALCIYCACVYILFPLYI